MGAFIAKQPNGRYCRFSTVIDTLTDINMTEEDYINRCVERAKEEALETLKKAKPFKVIDAYFVPYNNTREEFEHFKELASIPESEGPEWMRL